MAPQSIVVVGGSMAGLMHGLQLKREGHNVTILEREPVSERSSHEAGVGFKAGVEEILRRFDDTGRTASLLSNDLHFAYRRWPNVYKAKLRYQITNWGLLYRILRANFDGFASKACPTAPAPRDNDGQGAYLVGKEVTSLVQDVNQDKVTVQFTDVEGGKTEELVADLVIGADGVHSTVRELVKAPAVKKYSGYVSWRGTVKESKLSKETADYFANPASFSFNLLRRSYIICYVIPTDEGAFEAGERLVNWVWYYNVGESSAEMTEILTDIDGRERRNTVPQGLVAPAAWAKVRDWGVAKASAPFAELITKTERPFLTKVNDVYCGTAQHWGGRVLLVGDALSTFRPHVALATEQAANHSLWLGQALAGTDGMTMEVYEQKVAVYAKRIYLLSQLVGEFGQGSMWTFVTSLVRYLTFMVRLKTGRV